MSWIGTRPSPLRSDRSSTALIAYSPFAEIRIGQRAGPGSARPGRRRASSIHRLASHGGDSITDSPRLWLRLALRPHDVLRLALPRTAALQEPRRLAREVGDHHVGARP